MKLSAVQAARLTGRNERRIRDWIATRRLPATKVGQSWQIDLEDLERLPGIIIDAEQLALLQAQDAVTPHGLLSRIQQLEQAVQSLHTEILSLTTRLNHFERQQLGKSGDLQYSTDYQAKQTPLELQGYAPAHLENLVDFFTGQEHESLPPGSIRMKQFALLHKVHAAVLNYQIETGKIADTPVSTANGRKAHWLTPAQQKEVIAFWRRNGTHFIPCEICPHNGHN